MDVVAQKVSVLAQLVGWIRFDFGRCKDPIGLS
jgi:hypothetical protein